jgi:hypothetical protein
MFFQDFHTLLNIKSVFSVSKVKEISVKVSKIYHDVSYLVNFLLSFVLHYTYYRVAKF